MNTLKKIFSPKPHFASVGKYYVMNISTYKKYKDQFPLHFFSIHLDYNTEFVTIKQQCPVKKDEWENFSSFVLDGQRVVLEDEPQQSRSHYKFSSELNRGYERIVKRIFGEKEPVDSDLDYCKLCRNQLSCSFQSNASIIASAKNFRPLSEKKDIGGKLAELGFTHSPKIANHFTSSYTR